MILEINGKIKVIDKSKLKYKTREEYNVFAPLFYIISWEQYLAEFGEEVLQSCSTTEEGE